MGHVSLDLARQLEIGFERFNRREWDAIAAALPDDFEAIDHSTPDVRRSCGRNALRDLTGGGSVPIEDEVARVWTYTDGVVRRFEQFRNGEQVRRAAGA